MISNEKLVMLYREAGEKNRDIIFKKLWNNLSKGAMKICHFYCKPLLSFGEFDLFEDFEQEAKICLSKTIERFSLEKNAKFSTFYYTCLKNYIGDIFDKKFNILSNEMFDSAVIGWQKSNEKYSIEEYADNKLLFNILNKYISKISFTKKMHEDVFRDYFGFNKEYVSDDNFASLSRKYGITRMAVKKIYDKYFLQLKKILIENSELEKIKLFL